MTGMVQQPPARELTPEEAKQRAELCYELDQQVKNGLRAGRTAAWQVAQAVYQFDSESGWTALGYEKLADWLADPEVSMTYRTFRRYSDVWREVVVLRQTPVPTLAEVDVTKVDLVLPAVKDGRAKLEDALNDVRMMGARDLRETYVKAPDPPAADPPAPTAPDGEQDDEPPAPVNDGSEAPVRASEAPVGSTVPDEVLADETLDDVEGQATEVRTVPDKSSTPETIAKANGQPAHNTHDGDSGQVRTEAPIGYGGGEELVAFAREMAQMLDNIFERYASPEKKKIAKEDREALDKLVARAAKLGLLDV